MLPALAHPERVASPSIRGYFFQTVGIARQWLELNENEILLCEGDEDADRFILTDGVVQDVTQYQFKDVSGSLSARDEAIEESVCNFIRACKHHAQAGRRVRFVFTTSASRARQRTTSAASQSGHAVALSIDVLKAWETLPAGIERGPAVAKLIEALKSIVTAARPAPPIAGKVTKTHLDYAELEAAVDYLDSDSSRWTAFIDSVGWRFGEGTAREQMKKFEEALVLDERTNALPAEMVAERLLLRVLETSAEGEMRLRVLTRTGLNEIAGTSTKELEDWRNRVKADRLLLWIDEADRRLEQLEATAAVHGRQLEDHEDRIQKTESAPRARILAQSARGTRYLAQFATLNAKAGASGVHVEREVVGALADAALEGSLVHRM